MTKPSASRADAVRMRFPGIGRKVALYLALALAALVAMTALIGHKQGLFKRQTALHLLAPDASGIAVGMPVRLRGFSVGSVRELRMVRQGVEVRLGVASEHAAYIPYGSKARLAREGLIGASYIEILPGADGGARTVSDGESLPFDTTGSIAGLAEDLSQRLQPVVAGLQETVTWVNAPEGDLRQTLAATRKLMQEFSGTRIGLERFLGEATSLAGSVKESAASVGGTMSRELPKISDNANAAMREVGAAAAELRRATGTINERIGETSGKVGETLDEAHGVVSDAGEITSALKRSWPLNRALGAPATRTLRIDVNDTTLPEPAR